MATQKTTATAGAPGLIDPFKVSASLFEAILYRVEIAQKTLNRAQQECGDCAELFAMDDVLAAIGMLADSGLSVNGETSGARQSDALGWLVSPDIATYLATARAMPKAA